MIDQRIINAQQVLSELSGQLNTGTATVQGIERQKMIGDLLDRQPEETTYSLRHALEFIFTTMENNDASDLEVGGDGCISMLWFRINGKKQPVKDFASFTPDESDILLLNLLMKVQREELWENRQLHFGCQLMSPPGPMRFRVTMYFELNHLALSVRHIDTKIRPFRELGLHRHVARLLSLEYQKHGLALITGITGSGKSTTLDSIIDANNRQSAAHIVMIADPIEHMHTSQKSIIRQREIGKDVQSFKDGVVQSLRQDPDIIVIGETRDAETFSAVLEAADSGHKVFATLHTSSAVESIDRILGETPPMEQQRVRERLANLLKCVISQKLIPSLDGKRVLAKEVMVMTGAVRSAILNNHTDEIYQTIQQGNSEGMVTMEQDLARLYTKKIISKEEACNNANNKKRLDDLLLYHRHMQ